MSNPQKSLKRFNNALFSRRTVTNTIISRNLQNSFKINKIKFLVVFICNVLEVVQRNNSRRCCFGDYSQNGSSPIVVQSGNKTHFQRLSQGLRKDSQIYQYNIYNLSVIIENQGLRKVSQIYQHSIQNLSVIIENII